MSFVFTHNDSIYVIGGSEDDLDADLMYKFCLKTSTWSLVQQVGESPIFNEPKDKTVYKNKLYVFSRSAETAKFWSLNIYDFSTNTWTIKSTNAKNDQYPEDRLYESYAFSSTCAYMSGGSFQGSTIHYSDIWRMDFETLEWFKLDCSLKKGNAGHEMSVVNDTYLYSVGGNDIGNARLNILERFTIQPPSLYRLCLESVCISTNMTSYVRMLPAAIADELHLDDNDSSGDLKN